MAGSLVAVSSRLIGNVEAGGNRSQSALDAPPIAEARAVF